MADIDANRLDRLLRPRKIALFGGIWAENVARQLLASGFDGTVWLVHPQRQTLQGLTCYDSVEALPDAPDAAFIGVNRRLTVEIVHQLSQRGCGGAVCFASGFLESDVETSGGAELQSDLIAAAADMPILGPNCYGYLNYLDNVALWPDVHGGRRCEEGVAIITQSSNIAINMTMQQRLVPMAYMVAIGNQAQISVSTIGGHLLDDPRVTAVGLYLEGFDDIRAFEAFAQKARAAGKPVIALKIGRSQKARQTAITHTASLTGGAAASSALLHRLGIVEVFSIATFLESLKFLHLFGPLASARVCSISCSGGEASLMADMALDTALDFSDFADADREKLKALLGPIVTITNPLDYHTFIWGNVELMSAVFTAAMVAKGFDFVVFVFDLPRADRCDTAGFICAVEAIITAHQRSGQKVAVLSSLPENMPEAIAAQFMDAGIVPLAGMQTGIAAIDTAIRAGKPVRSQRTPVLLVSELAGPSIVLDEAAAKAALNVFGLPIPKGVSGSTVEIIAQDHIDLQYPLALKGLEIAHKSEIGAVRLNIRDQTELQDAVAEMAGVADRFLLEEMVSDTIAEILVGVMRDASGIFLLTIAAGGTSTELLQDKVQMLLPTDAEEISAGLSALRMAPLLRGYRGRPAADADALVAAIANIADYVAAHADRLLELDVNPLMVCKQGVVAADALIRLSKEETDE